MTEKRVPAYEFYKNRGFEEVEGQVSFFLDFRKPVIRPMKKSEYHLLDDFLYEAIFIPEGVDAPPKSIIQDDALQIYIKDFGDKPDDRCLAAVADGKVVGAVWTRIMKDYGHVDDSTPSFAISLYKEYRGKGIGTELMERMIGELKNAGYGKCSLAVQKENYAVKLYKKAGFEIVDENEEEYIMVRRLQL
ncbi:MAG: GNAT family N-acetyltransferase [Lachnospiraceae bacterium]|nr:GNAT family N-acetyltransferase [Lachnospiraceae bacterium]